MTAQPMRLRYSAFGGEGWIPRVEAPRDGHDLVWASFGAWSECGRLHSVLLHRPGPEVDAVEDAQQALWIELIDGTRAREQHDALAEVYRAHGITVHYLETRGPAHPNMFFMKDPFAMTPEGAVVSRPASLVRAGEERIVARTLAQLGVRIVLSVHGTGTFEGGDLMIVNDDLALIGQGLRTNEAGARQVEHMLRGMGIAEVVRVPLNIDCMHLDCGLSIVDRRLALIDANQVSMPAWEALRRHGFRVAEVTNLPEMALGLAINVVAIEPGLVVIPTSYPAVRRRLEASGVQCLPVEVDELLKGGGAIHCMTGVLQRERL